MTEDEAIELDRIIRKVSKRVCWSFPNIDDEDLGQSLWEYCLIAQVDPAQPGLSSFLYRKGKSYAWEIRKEQLKFSAQYSYLTEDVKLILETCFEPDTAGAYIPRDAKDGEIDGMAALEVRMDAMIAFRHLPDDYREIIQGRYAKNQIPEAGTAEQKRLSRAIKRLTDIMNSYYTGTSVSGRPGSRNVVSNATANYLIEEGM